MDPLPKVIADTEMEWVLEFEPLCGRAFTIPACECRFLRCSSAVALRVVADKSVADVYPRPHRAFNSASTGSAFSAMTFGTRAN
jgi:hypothetical protein